MNGELINSLSRQIDLLATGLDHELRHQFGALTKLERLSVHSFAGPDTTTSLTLERAEKTLRQLADNVEATRDWLNMNAGRTKTLAAAE